MNIEDYVILTAVIRANSCRSVGSALCFRTDIQNYTAIIGMQHGIYAFVDGYSA